MKPKTVEEYILNAPKMGQEKLHELYSLLKKIAPNATETLKWGKPVFESSTILFAFSVHKAHLSFIPTGPALKPFEKELLGYKVNKDSVQFPYHKPMPFDLIKKIAEYRVQDVEQRGAKWKY
jgi:uncharacterized protein YdhG (YjbR/CyaY superfamily)